MGENGFWTTVSSLPLVLLVMVLAFVVLRVEEEKVPDLVLHGMGGWAGACLGWVGRMMYEDYQQKRKGWRGRQA